MSTMHGGSGPSIKFFYDQAGSLEVYWLICIRVNAENVSWPSLDSLVRDSRFSRPTVGAARRWLIDHKALEIVEDYIRPQWRGLSKSALTRRKNLDRSRYLRPTGYIEFDGKQYAMLYIPQSEPSDAEDFVSDSQPGLPSEAPIVNPVDDGRGLPELDSTIKDITLLDKSKSVPAGTSTSNNEKKEGPPVLPLFEENTPAQEETAPLVSETIPEENSAPRKKKAKQSAQLMTKELRQEFQDAILQHMQLAKEALTRADFVALNQTVNILYKAQIRPADIERFVKWIRNDSASKGWTLTLRALTSAQRPALYYRMMHPTPIGTSAAGG